MKNKFLLFLAILTGTLVCSCIKLDENPYSTLVKDNFLITKDDVIRSTLRTYYQAYSSLVRTFEIEDAADQIMTPNREGHWFDAGLYYRLHYHNWTPQDRWTNQIWNTLYQGIAQANNSIEILQTIDAAKFGLTEKEIKQFIADLKVFRAWYHLKLLDIYRNIVIETKYIGADTRPIQSTPQETFDFIEEELTAIIADLPAKGDPGAGDLDGRWTKAGAMSLLVRLYLNAKVYTGVEKFTQCAAIAQDIIDRKYGDYSIEDQWDAPFDYDNNSSPETIFAFPSKYGYTSIHYTGGVYNMMIPSYCAAYFEVKNTVTSINFKYALQPGRDVDSVEYSFELGKPLVKIQKFGDDIRAKVYKNLGNSKREGMFLWGYVVDPVTGKRIRGTKSYDYYIRDQVGIFNRIDEEDKRVPIGPGELHLMTDKQSDMTHADENSGVYVYKYPYYPQTDPKSLESDYVEIRLAEIYYSLAECKFRAGDKAAAAVLLNAVRKRYYPAGSPSLYETDGSELTEIELLDEWGREFLVENHRRTDLIRFDKFTKGIWWDKTPDSDDHTNIMPIGQDVLGANQNLIQNPGY